MEVPEVEEICPEDLQSLDVQGLWWLTCLGGGASGLAGQPGGWFLFARRRTGGCGSDYNGPHCSVSW